MMYYFGVNCSLNEFYLMIYIMWYLFCLISGPEAQCFLGFFFFFLKQTQGHNLTTFQP